MVQVLLFLEAGSVCKSILWIVELTADFYFLNLMFVAYTILFFHITMMTTAPKAVVSLAVAAPDANQLVFSVYFQNNAPPCCAWKVAGCIY